MTNPHKKNENTVKTELFSTLRANSCHTSLYSCIKTLDLLSILLYLAIPQTDITA